MRKLQELITKFYREHIFGEWEVKKTEIKHEEKKLHVNVLSLRNLNKLQSALVIQSYHKKKKVTLSLK